MRCKTKTLDHLNRYSGDISGAFADLGTFLPLVLGLIAVNHFSPQGIFMGFGLFALFTAFYYRRPSGGQGSKQDQEEDKEVNKTKWSPRK